MSCFSGEQTEGVAAEYRLRREPARPVFAGGDVAPGFAVEVSVRMPHRLLDAVVVNQPIAVLDAVAEFVVIYLPAEDKRATPLQPHAHDLARAAVPLRLRVGVRPKPILADEDALARNAGLRRELRFDVVQRPGDLVRDVVE